MLKRILTVAVFGAALMIWPSCGGNDDQLKAEAFDYLRTELNGTWKATVTGEEVVLTFDLLDDETKVLMNKCSSRGILQAAWACITMYELPVTATLSSASSTYSGALTGTALGTGSAGSINLSLSGAATLNGDAYQHVLTATLNGGATSVTFNKQ